MMYDLAIVGGGPAGVAAGVYAARKLLKTVLITEAIGGQSTDSVNVQNWIGTPSISGIELAKKLEEHLNTYKGDVVEVVLGDRVTTLVKKAELFTITTRDGKSFDAKAVLIATGAVRRKLTVPGADKLEHKGLTYCASCDGPLFSGMDVAVIGGGNAAFESAAQLLAYAKSVTLLNRSERFRADPITVKTVLAHEHMKVIQNADVTAVEGEAFVRGLRYKIKGNEEERALPVAGIFVEIGLIPGTDFLEGVVDIDAEKRVIVDPKNQKTNTPGIWAAGDCTNELYHQNNIAAGDAVKALEDIYVELKTR